MELGRDPFRQDDNVTQSPSPQEFNVSSPYSAFSASTAYEHWHPRTTATHDAPSMERDGDGTSPICPDPNVRTYCGNTRRDQSVWQRVSPMFQHPSRGFETSSTLFNTSPTTLPPHPCLHGCSPVYHITTSNTHTMYTSCQSRQSLDAET